MVAAAFCELVDVSSIQGSFTIQRYHPIMGESTRVIVSRKNAQSELAELWSAAACCRFTAGHLAGRDGGGETRARTRSRARWTAPHRTASKLAKKKRQQAASLQSCRIARLP